MDKENLQKAITEFETAVKLFEERAEKLTEAIKAIPAAGEKVSTDTLLAFSALKIYEKAKAFPIKHAAVAITAGVALSFSETLMATYTSNRSKFDTCPIHGPNCIETVGKDEFPDLIDEHLMPIQSDYPS